MNPIRSFKGRGADWLLRTLSAAGENLASLHLVCASAGNFGQGLAYTARQRGVRVTVFAALRANPRKIERMRQLGADVQLAGADFDEAKVLARAWAGERPGARFIEDGREVAIAEGAGTIGVELTHWCEQAGAVIDIVLVPLGNGALLAGVGHWMRARSPTTQIIGVVAAGAPAMERSWRAGSVVRTATVETLADGIAVREPVPEALEQLAGVVDDIVLVDDAAMSRAAGLATETLGLVTEMAGAAGLAAVVSDASRYRGARIAVPLCGGNVTSPSSASV